MTTLHRRVRWLWVGLIAAAVPAVFVGGASSPARAAGPAMAADWIPEDAAFFGSMLRNREQWDIIAQSRAWAKLKALPVLEMGRALYAMQAMNADSVPGKIEKALRDAEVKRALDLACDMLSHEVFLYGGRGTTDFLELCQQLQGANVAASYGRVIALLKGEGKGVGGRDLQQQALVSALCQNAALLKVPELVLGFRVTNLELARQELARLELLATAVLATKPELQGRLKKTTVDGHEYLTLTLDGGMIPWEQGVAEKLRELASQPGDADKLVARLKAAKLVVSIGLRGDYLLVAIGPSTEVLARLGHGRSLRTRPEWAPLAKFADKPLVSLGYLSKPMAARVGYGKQDIDQLLAELVDEVLPLVELPDEGKQEIRKDAAALAADIKGLMPEPGAMFAFGFLAPGGSESYSYDWSGHPELDASQPLPLLQHVGGGPLVAAVNRAKVSVAAYDLLAKWLAVGYRYMEKYALPQMPAGDRAKFDRLMEGARPLLAEADDTTRHMLLPALADGQMGLVLDRKLSSKQYLAKLPATPQPLPMIEPALVFGVSDAALLERAVARYWKIANGLVDAARAIDEANKIPADFRIPAAARHKIPQGTMYAYPLPKAWGVDPQILPNAGLSEHVAVLSVSRGHTERLLRATPPNIGGRTLPTGRPLAAAGGVDFAGLIDALIPWVDFAFDKAAGEESSGQIEPIRQQVRTVLDVLKVLRTVTFETYREGSALVVHSRADLKDVE
jgi:hypothetical protein